MAQLDTTPTPSLTLEEVLSDGSTITNPPADNRRLFLGEDGLVHLKDSAGAVTDVGSGGGGATGWLDYTTDGVQLDTGRFEIWDANLDAKINLDGSIVLAAGVGWGIEFQPDSGQVVEISNGDGLVFPSLAADPTAVADGHVYYNSSTDKLRLRANGAWVDLN